MLKVNTICNQYFIFIYLFIYLFIYSLPRVIVQPKLVLHEPCITTITNIKHIKYIVHHARKGRLSGVARAKPRLTFGHNNRHE